ncbi:MAG: exodeoxyribonuclease VII small subunit [Clostridiales bacterium]|nr:exodeoxyribonuclease VII small subunit [Clostridiales bacterium]
MANNEMTFEQALARLDEIVTILEKGNAPLEQSMILFEEGIALSKRCSAALEKAEQKVTILIKNSSGTITEQRFESSTEE